MKTKGNTKLARGFALIATLTILSLLVMVSLALVSLSTTSVKSQDLSDAMAHAKANARLALAHAIARLQTEMGPDMRISVEAAIHDSNPATEEIDDIEQPHWAGVYNSWGTWLNAEYDHDSDNTTSDISIQDTYVSKRAPMFRSWLVSLPEDMQSDILAPVNGLPEDDTSTILVGAGTLGEAYATANPEKVTRAHKISVNGNGKYAWLVLPENHKAKISLAADGDSTLSADRLSTAQGNSPETAVGLLDGLDYLNNGQTNAAEIADNIITDASLMLGSSGDDEFDQRKALYYDVTTSSYGLLVDVKFGKLKEDLTLLFESPDTLMPEEYQLTKPPIGYPTDFGPEPSIRPHSKDLLAIDSYLPRRPFSSWTNMRHFYRLYRDDSEDQSLENSTPFYGGEDRRELQNGSDGPKSGIVVAVNPRIKQEGTSADPGGLIDSDVLVTEDRRIYGENMYQRVPIMTRYLLIHSYTTPEYFDDKRGRSEFEYAFNAFSTPIITYWNPYNVPLEVEDDFFGAVADGNHTWPTSTNVRAWRTDYVNADKVGGSVPITNGSSTITFQPGEFKTFSFKAPELQVQPDGTVTKVFNGDLWEDYDPSLVGYDSTTDDSRLWYRRITDKKDLIKNRGEWYDIHFTHCTGENYKHGQNPGSLCVPQGYMNELKTRDNVDPIFPMSYNIDWFQKDDQYKSILPSRAPTQLGAEEPLPMAYTMLTLKGVGEYVYSGVQSGESDWRGRNWLFSPPDYFGSAMYISEDDDIAAAQKVDSPYFVAYGPTSTLELPTLTNTVNGKPTFGYGTGAAWEQITAVATKELPTAPISSLAGFANMRMNPGWIWFESLNPEWERLRHRTGKGNDIRSYRDNDFTMGAAANKMMTYQSGVVGVGVGNSFIHPAIPRDGVYKKIENSWSQEQGEHKNTWWHTYGLKNPNPDKFKWQDPKNTKAYSDYWDHLLLLNDSLWDGYFLSSIGDQTRGWTSESNTYEQNLDLFIGGGAIPNTRFKYFANGQTDEAVKDKLFNSNTSSSRYEFPRQYSYQKTAEHIMVDGAFNVNSTSVKAWYALFAGIRNRAALYRQDNGTIAKITHSDDEIVLTRFAVSTTDQEVADPLTGVTRSDGNAAWSGVRFISNAQLQILAEKCVEQVKERGPFLNFSEFINRRLSTDDYGLMGALQMAIDYDDFLPADSPAPTVDPINDRFKSDFFTMKESDLPSGVDNVMSTPEAFNGSRFAGIPGYVVQSDLLRPISNTLTVRDDTFKIRAYGEHLDSDGNVLAMAWCEAIVQRTTEYFDPTDSSEEASQVYTANVPDATYDPRWDGEYGRNNDLSDENHQKGRRFVISSFRWLNQSEI